MASSPTTAAELAGQLALAFSISAIIVALALWRGSLSTSGAAGALIVGTLIFAMGGWIWGILLGIFFVTSSLFSHFKEEEKKGLAEKFDKGHRRDVGQVLANGGLGAVVAVANFGAPSDSWFVFFLGVMATVTADTWATELGTLARRPPRLITTGRVVEVGTSGGVSPLGTIVSLTGGLVIGLAAGLLAGGYNYLPLLLAGAFGGLGGSLFDSLLGATVQRIYYCDICQKETERRLHRGAHITRPLRGWWWLNNDLVNFISSVIGGSLAVGLWRLLT